MKVVKGGCVSINTVGDLWFSVCVDDGQPVLEGM
tara:strand:- start:657 stop:758 length:102 start_codon:yes stop_codon:yes gene_type:complete